MSEARVQIGTKPKELVVRINSEDPTFLLRTDAIRFAAMAELDDRSLDFLEIASVVFAADSGVSRGGATRDKMGEAWRRDFHFEIQVREPEFWNREEIRAALKAATEFLTDDHVAFEFVQADAASPSDPFLNLDPNSSSFQADEVIMFSGGLDSFSGALETLATTDRRVVLVTHRSAQKVIPRQVYLGQVLAKRFPDRVLHVHVMARRKGQEAAEATQRSRTLLFTALGHAVAQVFQAKRLSFYENGIVSQNLPISEQIVGTMATRTTHPMSLAHLNHLLDICWPNGPRIRNRYEWLTKTEVVQKIHVHGEAREIPKAVSCTSIRDQTQRFTHCGACTQCLDRRFAILAAGLDQYDKPEDYKTDVLLGERTTTQSRTIALEWTRHALRVGLLDEAQAMATFGLELSRILKGHADLEATEALRRTVEMQHRHSAAVRQVLGQMLALHATEMADHVLAADCLLVMHVGQSSAPPAEERKSTAAPDWMAADDGDLQPNETPSVLRVAFPMRNGTSEVAVEGLGRITGQRAAVAHGLKPAFDEDRARGLEPDDHRYVQSRNIVGCEAWTNEAVRKQIQRCRKDLSEFYVLVHGREPPDHLLIQNRPTRGYRLDPTIELFALDDG